MGMPILDPKAIKSVMIRHNYIFKHQVANLVGISYEHLARILVDDETEVEEEIVRRFCAGLDCERSEIVIES
jgi:DNA-binding Xre family transcriptional regulator